RSVDRVAMQVARVFDGDANHAGICKCASSRAIVLSVAQASCLWGRQASCLTRSLLAAGNRRDARSPHRQDACATQEHDDYDKGATIGDTCNLSACLASCSRNTFVNAESCKMFMSVLCFRTSSFSHDSFHQTKPITAGQRLENKSSSAFLAQSFAST